MNWMLWGGILLAVVLFLVGMKVMKWIMWGIGIFILISLGVLNFSKFF